MGPYIIHIYIYNVYIHILVCMYTCMYVYTYIHIDVCRCVLIHVYLLICIYIAGSEPRGFLIRFLHWAGSGEAR